MGWRRRRLSALLDNLAGAATEQQVIVGDGDRGAAAAHASAGGGELPLLDGEDVRDRAEAVRVWAALRLAIPGYRCGTPVFAMLRAARRARAIFDAYASAYKRGTFATEARAHDGRRRVDDLRPRGVPAVG